jgi:predicted Na+-dependent transporter
MIRKSADIAEAINIQMERFMPFLPPLGIVLGYFLSGVFIHLRPLVPWLFGLITLTGALRLRAAEFGSTIRSPLPILAFFIVAHALMPLFALFAASFFFNDSPGIVIGFVLLFAGPVAVSSFIWVTIFRGDKALCLTLILLDTLLAPIIMPGTISILMGAKTALNMSAIAVSLIFMVVIPTIIGVMLNETSRGRIPNAICPYLSPFSKFCLLLVVAANTSPVASTIRFGDPASLEANLWGVAALCMVLSASGFILSKLAAGVVRCNAEKSASLLFSGGLKNNSAVTIIAVSFFPEAAAVPSLLAILFQQTLSAILGKLLFRKPSGKT